MRKKYGYKKKSNYGNVNKKNVKQIVKKILSQESERKHYVTNTATTLAGWNYAASMLSVPNGVSQSNRVGNAIRAKHIKINVLLTNSIITAYRTQVVRILIWTNRNGQNPTSPPGSVTAPLSNSFRTEASAIYYDKCHVLTNQMADSPAKKYFTIYIPLYGKNVEYESTATGRPDNLDIWFGSLVDAPSNPATVEFNSELVFFDP